MPIDFSDDMFKNEIHLVKTLHRAAFLNSDGPYRNAVSTGKNDVLSANTEVNVKELGWQRKRSVREFAIVPMETNSIEDALVRLFSSKEGTFLFPSAGRIYGNSLFLVSNKGQMKFFNHKNFKGIDMPLKFNREQISRSVFHQFSGEYCLLMIFADLSKYLKRYGIRGYRYALIEAGHIMQELIRSYQKLGFEVCPIGSFCDESWVELSGGQFSEESPVYGLAVGQRVKK